MHLSLISLFPSFPPPLELEEVCSVSFFLYGRDFPYINANILRIIHLFGSALMVEEHLPYPMEEILRLELARSNWESKIATDSESQKMKILW